MTSQDAHFMKRALELAELGRGKAHPNPLVGAVLVKRGKIIGEGAHERYGQSHAEVNAIFSCKADPKGATLYVNLEPCAHFGKTPPCTDLILASKLRRVVVGMKDPNRFVAGRGLKVLKKAGVEVDCGVLEDEARELNRDYCHWVVHQRPYVIVKAAQSLDGKIATSTGDSKWITEKKSRIFSHELRASSDAILVGVNTILKDDPRLDTRLASIQRYPVKVVLDSFLRTPSKARIFSKTSRNRVVLVTTKRAPQKQWTRLEKKAEIMLVPEKKKGFIDWNALLGELGSRGIVNLLIEGGGEVIGSAIREKIVHEMVVFVAPKIIGGKSSISAVGGEGIQFLKEAANLRDLKAEPIGGDLLLRGRF